MATLGDIAVAGVLNLLLAFAFHLAFAFLRLQPNDHAGILSQMVSEWLKGKPQELLKINSEQVCELGLQSIHTISQLDAGGSQNAPVGAH